MRPQKLFLVIAVLSFMFLSAAECEDQCSKCQSAIDHMYEKIEVQACNPNTMQKAWDQIREECDHFDSAVGLMAETCSLGNTARPGCNVPTINLKAAGININLVTQYMDFDFDIIFQFPRADFHFGSDQLEESEDSGFYDKYFLFDVDVAEGETIEIIVINVETDKEIGRKSVNFSFDRKNSWSSVRGMEISVPNPIEQSEAFIRFFYWT